jgi:hypothetical protein
MANKQQPALNKSAASDHDELESLNAQTRARRNPPMAIRRSMEAQIEAKAKRRRQGELAAAAAARKGLR